MLKEELNQILQCLLQSRILPDPEEIAIGLQDMEVGIHGLALVLIFLTEPQVLQSFPIPGKGIGITVKLQVKGLGLKIPE